MTHLFPVVKHAKFLSFQQHEVFYTVIFSGFGTSEIYLNTDRTLSLERQVAHCFISYDQLEM